jgi:hypothetical protein
VRRSLVRADLLTGLVLCALLGVALVTRLVNLDAYTGKFDEGIRLEQLLLMRAGFRPVRDIFAGQGPLSLDLFYGPYLWFGQSLAAARGAVVLCSLFALLAAYWTASQVAGRLAGLLAVLLLVLSPLYLKNSRLALLEVPALAPAMLALGAALRYQRDGRRGWLALSAVALASALLIKPLVIGVAVPIGLSLLAQPGRRRCLTDLLRYALIVLAVGALVVALYGAEQVWQQVVVYRGSARSFNGWSLKENWSILSQELRDEPLPFYALAITSALALAAFRPRLGLPLALWPLTNLALLLVYSPLQFKHAAILLPSLALVTAVALSKLGQAAWAAWASRDYGTIRLKMSSRARPATCLALLVAAALTLLVWYLVALPATLRQLAQVMSGTAETRVETYADESRFINQLTGPSDFVLVDDPIVAYNARRLVPPALVDSSSYRVRSGALRGRDVVGAVEQFDVRLLFLFSDGLRELDSVDDFVDDRYRAIWIAERQNGKDRALYLRDDADLTTARALLGAGLQVPPAAEFGGDLRLVGYNLIRDELPAGASTSLILHWEALRPMTPDYHVVTRLRGPDSQADYQSEKALGGGGEGTASWEPGRWVVRSQMLTVPPRAVAGDYRLTISVYDSKARLTAPLAGGGVELPLGLLEVR